MHLLKIERPSINKLGFWPDILLHVKDNEESANIIVTRESHNRTHETFRCNRNEGRTTIRTTCIAVTPRDVTTNAETAITSESTNPTTDRL